MITGSRGSGKLSSCRIDPMQAFTQVPPPLDFIWSGFLTGTVGTLFAPGATSKSFWAIQAAIAVCGGGDTVGIEPGGFGRVVYLAAEDPACILQHRLHAIGAHLDPVGREAVGERLDLLSVVGAGLDVGDAKQRDELIEYCIGARLIIIDTISRAHQLDENSNGEMARLLNFLEIIACRTGAAMLFLHHISKGASRLGDGGDQYAARGAGALTDNARMGAALSKMTETESLLADRSLGAVTPIGSDGRARYVRMSVPKNNYSPPIADRWYRRDAGGVLVPVDLVDARTELKKAGQAPKARRGLANVAGIGAEEFDRRASAQGGAPDEEGWTYVAPF